MAFLEFIAFCWSRTDHDTKSVIVLFLALIVIVGSYLLFGMAGLYAVLASVLMVIALAILASIAIAIYDRWQEFKMYKETQRDEIINRLKGNYD